MPARQAGNPRCDQPYQDAVEQTARPRSFPPGPIPETKERHPDSGHDADHERHGIDRSQGSEAHLAFEKRRMLYASAIEQEASG